MLPFAKIWKTCPILLSLLSGLICADERKVSPDAFSAYNYEVASRAENLHRINLNDISGLKASLQKDVAIDVKVLWDMIKTGGITEKEKSRAYGVLRLIAVQNEKFPNPAFNSDEHILSILKEALDLDPQKTAEVRSRNWEKPWWQK